MCLQWCILIAAEFLTGSKAGIAGANVLRGLTSQATRGATWIDGQVLTSKNKGSGPQVLQCPDN